MRRESLDQLLTHVLQPLVRAEDLLARLDTRVAHSPCGDGFRARQHFADAAAALWLDGELVHVEELVLHDGRMDTRAPTHEITRAHDVLRTRRRIADRAPDWALSPGGLAALRRREGEGGTAPAIPKAKLAEGDPGTLGAGAAENDALAEELAEIDAVLARAGQTLAGTGPEGSTGRGEDFAPAAPPWPLPAAEPDPGQAELSPAAFALLRDPDHDEEALVEQWRARLAALKGEDLPPVVTAFLAWDAWEALRPLDRQHWLGPLLVAALLRRCDKAKAYLPALAVGLREVPRAERRSPDPAVRCRAFLEALEKAARAGLKEIDRLELAAAQMERRLKTKRRHSHLPHLAQLVLSRPVVTTALIAAELKVTQRGALNLVSELGVREITGRGRYRAWGVL